MVCAVKSLLFATWRARADAGLLAGAGAIGYGLWQIYEPAAWLAGGIAVAVYSLDLAALERSRNGRR